MLTINLCSGWNDQNSFASGDSLIQKQKNVEYWEKEAFKDIPIDQKSIFDTQSPKIEFKKISEQYNSNEFNYEEDHNNYLSIWDRISRRVDQFINSLFPNWTATSHRTIIYLLIIVGILAFITIIYKVIFSGNKVIGKEKKETHESEIQFIERNLNIIEIDKYIEKAIKEGQYELAIRYLHLSNIQALSKKGIIEWDYRKTNNDFVSEIKDELLKDKFRETNVIFNYIWFGKFAINKTQFETYKNELINFKNQLGK